MQILGLPLMLALSVPLQITDPGTAVAGRKTFNLSAARNHVRPLLLFAPRGSDPLLSEQLDLLKTADLLDRNIVVVPLLMHGVLPVGNKLASSVIDSMRMDESAAARQRFHVVSSEFTVILLGKDGDEKMRSLTPVTMQRLNHVVDAMPMRQHEMRSRN